MFIRIKCIYILKLELNDQLTIWQSFPVNQWSVLNVQMLWLMDVRDIIQFTCRWYNVIADIFYQEKGKYRQSMRCSLRQLSLSWRRSQAIYSASLRKESGVSIVFWVRTSLACTCLGMGVVALHLHIEVI